jgi:hypothetical protein
VITFEKVLELRTFEQHRLSRLHERLPRRMNLEAARRYRRAWPKRKPADCWAIVNERAPLIGAEVLFSYRPIAEQLHKVARARVDRLERVLVRLARDAQVPVTESTVELERVYASSWNSQGLGRERYARAAADAVIDRSAAAGVPASSSWNVEHQCFVVLANTNELGAEMLRRKPQLPMREWVRRCWARGVNPRVYFPFLPHGFEERNGLDFFGNDLRAQVAS